MPVSEYGEIGRLVQYSKELDMVILWAVYEKRYVDRGNPDDKFPAYRTSRGWIAGKRDENDYFAPTPRERSLTGCIRRAAQYAKINWPDKPAQTH